MDERKQAELSPPPVGGASLLVVFAVLCLTVFALLSLSTVRANGRLSEASAQAVADYYAADCAAQEILARLRNEELPEGVDVDGDTYRFSCPISEGQTLEAEVRLEGGSGRASVESPAALRVEDGTAYASVVWGSSNYSSMRIGEETFAPVNTSGNSAFEIPVSVFDRKLAVYAETTAMSTPHEIEYTLYFDASTIKNAE